MPVPKFKPEACKSCGAAKSVVNGAWLRERREAAGLSLRELSKRIGFSAPYMSDVEHNRRNCTPAIRAFYESLQEPPR